MTHMRKGKERELLAMKTPHSSQAQLIKAVDSDKFGSIKTVLIQQASRERRMEARAARQSKVDWKG